MNFITGAAIFFMIWWVVLFAVLPWGVRSQRESGEIAPGTDPGAPAMTYLGRKLFWTTVVAVVVFGSFYFAFLVHPVTFAGLFGLNRH